MSIGSSAPSRANSRPSLSARNVVIPVAALPGLIWAVPFVGLARLLRRTPDLADQPVGGSILLSVIIPARNEADSIATVVASILASTYQELELLVVDDCSTDNTRDILASLAASDPRLRLIDGTPLPAGWLGKPWACAQGAAAASGEYLLFTDADTVHSPALLGHAVGAMTTDAIDLLTLTSRQLCLTFWERVVMPQIWVLLAMRYPPSAINSATHDWQLVANGQFIMVRRTAYQSWGGHQAVGGEVVEDLALAQVCFRAGFKLRMMWGESLLSTRMYRSLGALVEGWSKNLYLGARRSSPGSPILRALAPFGVMASFLFWLVPFAALAAGVSQPAALTAIGSSLMFWLVMNRGMAIPAWYAPLYPLGAMVALGIVIRSTLRGAQQVEWRGRTYSVSG